jgi:hypothetical protein
MVKGKVPSSLLTTASEPVMLALVMKRREEG